MSLERDYTNDYEDWLRNNPPVEQGKPEPPGGSMAPPATSGPKGPPYTMANPPPPNTDPSTEWIFNPTTGQFELRPRNVAPPNNTDPTPTPSPTPGPSPYPTGPSPWEPTNNSTMPTGGYDGPPQLNFDPYQSAGPFQPRDDTFEYTPFSYRDFSYDPYTASSWEDAEKEPGYDASRKQLKGQIEGGAAYRGMLRSGMTLKDIYTGLDSLGQQNFANFDNRRFRNYSANRDNSFQSWQGNRDNAFQSWSGNLGAAAQKFGLELGVDRDIYDRGATDVDRRNNYNFNTKSAQAADALARWQEQVRSLTNISTAGMGAG